jgi:hypothetical protein
LPDISPTLEYDIDIFFDIPVLSFRSDPFDDILGSVRDITTATDKSRFESIAGQFAKFLSSHWAYSSFEADSRPILQKLFDPTTWWVGDSFSEVFEVYLRPPARDPVAEYSYAMASADLTRGRRLRVWQSFALDLLSSLKFRATNVQFEEAVVESFERSLGDFLNLSARACHDIRYTEPGRSFRDQLLAFELHTGISPPGSTTSTITEVSDHEAVPSGDINGTEILESYGKEAVRRWNGEGGSG